MNERQRRGLCLPEQTHHLPRYLDSSLGKCVHCGLTERQVQGHATVDTPPDETGDNYGRGATG